VTIALMLLRLVSVPADVPAFNKKLFLHFNFSAGVFLTHLRLGPRLADPRLVWGHATGIFAAVLSA